MDRALESLDLRFTFAVMTFTAALLSIILAQLTSHTDSQRGLTPLLLWARRSAFYAMVFSLLWALYYGSDKGWQPWPPMIAILLVLNAHYLIRIICHAHYVGALQRWSLAALHRLHLL